MGAVAPSLSSLTMHSVTSILAASYSKFGTILAMYIFLFCKCKTLTEFIFTTFSQSLVLVSFCASLRNKIDFSVSYTMNDVCFRRETGGFDYILC